MVLAGLHCLAFQGHGFNVGELTPLQSGLSGAHMWLISGSDGFGPDTRMETGWIHLYIGLLSALSV